MVKLYFSVCSSKVKYKEDTLANRIKEQASTANDKYSPRKPPQELISVAVKKKQDDDSSTLRKKLCEA